MKPRKKVNRFPFSVVGMQYRVTLTTRRMLAAKVPIECELEREPENVHDKNAIAVVVAGGGFKNLFIGYLIRQTAEILAPSLDDGSAVVTSCHLTEVDAERGEGEVTVGLKRT